MADDKKLPERIDADIAGVQGEAPEDVSAAPAAPGPDALDQGTPVQAPDGAEIEWAGALVKKAPRAPE